MDPEIGQSNVLAAAEEMAGALRLRLEYGRDKTWRDQRFQEAMQATGEALEAYNEAKESAEEFVGISIDSMLGGVVVSTQTVGTVGPGTKLTGISLGKLGG